jgi:hypothetical protein
MHRANVINFQDQQSSRSPPTSSGRETLLRYGWCAASGAVGLATTLICLALVRREPPDAPATGGSAPVRDSVAA